MASTPTPKPQAPAAMMGIIVSVVIGLGVLAEFVFWNPQQQPATFIPIEFNWLLGIGATALFIIALGYSITGHWLSLFVDNRNKISLSRFQLVLWTVLLLPAIVLALLQNARASDPPISVYLTGAVAQAPLQLQVRAGCTVGDVLLGVTAPGSSADCVLSALYAGAASTTRPPGRVMDVGILAQGNLGHILQNGDHVDVPASGAGQLITVQNAPPVGGQGNSTGRDVNIPQELWLLMGVSTTSLVGSALIKSNRDQNPQDKTKMQRNNSPSDARFLDMVRGEEMTNHDDLDLAKVQMLYFTIGLVIAYGVSLWTMFVNGKGIPISQFPALGSGVVTLLAISHAGYLTNKAIPKNVTGVTITANKAMVYNGGSVSVAVNEPDPNTKYTWNFGDNSVPMTGSKVDHQFTQVGIFTIEVYASDQTGVSNASLTITVNTINAAADPASPAAGQVVTFNVRNVDPGATYTWDFGDGSPAGNGAQNVQHSFAKSGPVTVTVTATYSTGGNNSASVQVIVT